MRRPIVKTLLSILLVAVVLVGGTLAYLMATDSPVLNTFTLAEVETNVEEPDSGTAVEKNAKVSNTGKSAVYVRAMAVVSSGDASVDPGLIAVTQYGSSWENGGDGFYYYTEILPAGQTTRDPLFTGVTVSKDVPETATFSVDVYQESVLAPADGTYSLKAAQDAFAAKG